MNTNDTEHRRNEIGVLTDIHPCWVFSQSRGKGFNNIQKIIQIKITRSTLKSIVYTYFT